MVRDYFVQQAERAPAYAPLYKFSEDMAADVLGHHPLPYPFLEFFKGVHVIASNGSVLTI